MTPDLPIGVFDSGVGGLTVLREISRKLPNESLVYLGDSARLPYGTKSPSTIRRYSQEAAAFLMERGIKMLVVACNTASAAAVNHLRRELSVPVIGVIEPGARAAVARSRGHIGVIATEGTIRSGAYRSSILEISPDFKVTESACPLFVPLAEEGWANTRVCREIAEIYLEPLIDARIDTLVLGCTHYPILRQTLRQVVGPEVEIVDSAETTAEQVSRELIERNMLSRKDRRSVTIEFLVTDDTARFRKIAGEFLDHAVTHLELVDLPQLPVAMEVS